MKGKFIVLLILCLVLTGCSFTTTRSQLNVRFRNIRQDTLVQALDITSEEGGLTVEEVPYSYVPNALSSTLFEIEADLSGKTDKMFDFELTTRNKYERVAPNKVVLTPEQPEKGIVKVAVEGQEKVVEYEIFPSGVVWETKELTALPGFDFETGTSAVKGHLYPIYNSPPRERPTLKANVCILDLQADDFWTDFVSIKDVTSYEYKETEFKPDFRKLYLIKTDHGYAVVRFDVYTGVRWSFIYKYSETGIFE